MSYAEYELAVDISLLSNAPTNFSLAGLTEVLLMIKFCWNVKTVSSGNLKVEEPKFLETWVTVYRFVRPTS
jgi:hypothetical protein